MEAPCRREDAACARPHHCVFARARQELSQVSPLVSTAQNLWPTQSTPCTSWGHGVGTKTLHGPEGTEMGVSAEATFLCSVYAEFWCIFKGFSDLLG